MSEEQRLPPLESGATLGRFVIHRLLGAGGMGEVYEAEDTRLHRRVALKMIRHDVAADPRRRARLEREASAVAMLNHPHIVTVHSLDEHDGRLFITMELVDGVTLAHALPSEGFPLDRALALSSQLADALAAAHAVGVVHRDLKPANIMITRDGAAKVLDFGLSKLVVDDPSGTVTTEVLTREGHLVGTAPYVSPEQIDGHEADERSDIFSLGVVMFELVTGQRPFAGRTALAMLTSISKDTPQLANELNPAVPDPLARIIDRCLIKDPARRIQSALDLHGQLDDLTTMMESPGWRTTAGSAARRGRTQVTSASRNSSPWTWAATVAAGVGLLGITSVSRLTLATPGPRPTDGRVVRFTVEVPNGAIPASFNSHVALSPDGAQLAITPLPGPVILRRLNALESQPLEVTKTPGFRGGPVFSPDGSMISFIEGNAIFSWTRPFYRAALSGGAPVKLADYDAFHEGSWSDDGWLYWTAQYPGGIVRTSEEGGSPQSVTHLDVQRGERSHRFARVLPGDELLAYTVSVDGLSSYDDAHIDLLDVRTGQKKTVITGGTAAAYSPSGHLVYARQGKLFAVPFDLGRRQVTGQPFEALNGVLMSSNTGAAEFSISRSGDLAYVPGRAVDGHRTLVWVDRSGRTEPLPLPPASYLYPRLSPDGKYLAVEIEGPNHDLYLYDFARAVLTKITTDGLSHDPVWTPDGKRLVFRSWQAGGMTMWVMPADRSAGAERLDPNGTRQSPVSVSSDGRYLAFDQKDPQSGDDAWVMPLDGNGTAQPVARSRFSEGSAKFSPDGRWIAYASNESGRAEVYVQPFPGPGPKVQVSNGGGFDPMWRRTGGELYYRSAGKMMVVSIATTPAPRVSPPRELWSAVDYTDGSGSSCGMPGVSSANYDVTPDGQRFLMVRDDDIGAVGHQVVVVTNWARELRGRSGQR